MYNKRNSKNNSLKVFLLNSLSIIFKIISLINLKLKSIMKQSFKDIYIISIDNLAFGGTGKTPLVINIGKELKKKKINFCIITRGYKSKFEKRGIKVNTSHSIKDIGDEAALFRSYFPDIDIYIGKNRQRSIEKAIKDNNKIIILDDGFQTTGLIKDLKIMLLNPEHEYYYLRNFKFLIKQDDIILSLKKDYNFIIEGLYDIKNNRVQIPNSTDIIGFSALGDNKRFRQTLIDLKHNIIDFIEYSDHFSFSENDLNLLNNIRKEKKSSYLVCSEKDFIKLKDLNIDKIPLIYVKNSIKLNISLTEKILLDAERKQIKT